MSNYLLIWWFTVQFSWSLKRPPPETIIELGTLTTNLDSQDSTGSFRAHGECNPSTKRVIIDTNHFNSINYYEKRVLVFHELGHCELGFGHVYEDDIMLPRFYSVKPDGSNWEELLQKFKDRYDTNTFTY